MNNTPVIKPVGQLTTEEKIQEWQQIKLWAAQAKTRESELRTAIALTLFGPDATPSEVRKAKNVFSGAKGTYSAKIERGLKWEVDISQRDACFTAAELTAEESAEMLRTKYELVMKPYNKLSPEKKAKLAPMLTTKPESMTLEIEFTPLPS